MAPSSSYFSASRRPASELVSVRLAPDLLARLAAVGNAEGLAMSDTIRLVLERGLAASERKPK
jgi:antitoxin component of RelBE/YafQ-DinJ toxin-antitoxin module